MGMRGSDPTRESVAPHVRSGYSVASILELGIPLVVQRSR